MTPQESVDSDDSVNVPEIGLQPGEEPLECALLDPWKTEERKTPKGFPEWVWEAVGPGGMKFRLRGGKGLRIAIEGAAIRHPERPLRVSIGRMGSGLTDTRYTVLLVRA